MRVSRLLNMESNSKGTFTLATDAKPQADGNANKPDPKSEKTTPEFERISASELERAYILRPNVFNGINKIVQTIMSAKFNVVSPNKEIQEYINNFLINIGLTGGHLSWDELIDRCLRYKCIYGDVYFELIENSKGSEIIDLDFIDTKKMDYAKDSEGKIVLDDYGNAVGYVEKLPMNMTVENKIKPPDEVSLSSNEIYLPAERVAHFKLYAVGDGFYGIGLIEPAYKSIIRGMNMEEALANWTYNSGFPPRIAKVGDERNIPTPNKIDSALKAIKSLNYKQNLSVPYYMDVSLLEARSTENIKDNLEYFKDAEITALGIPKPFVTGGGEETNRATLGNQDSLFRLTLKDIMKQFSAQMKKYVFRPIIKKRFPNAEESDMPTMEWGDLPPYVSTIDKDKSNDKK
ncbi:MAG: phage portal protein family protein [Elusimicrobiota bacterium]